LKFKVFEVCIEQMRYVYNVTIADTEFECADVHGVVKAVNERSFGGSPVLTEAMVFSLLTRPHRANKRLFAGIKIDRTRLPTKAELLLMEQASSGKSHPPFSVA